RNDEALRAKRRAAGAEIEQALQRVPLRSLEQALVLANRKAELAEIKAPVAGTVLKVNVSEGDSIGRGALLELAGVKRMIAVAEVYETDVPLLREWLRHGPVEAEVS